MFGHAKPVIDRTIATRGKGPCGFAHGLGINTGDTRNGFGAVARIGNKCCPILEFIPVTAFTHKRFVKQAFGHNHMGK